MIYITGDTHGGMDIKKLNSHRFPEGCKLTKNDYVIVLGDFGMVFYNERTKDEQYWLEWLNDKPWTTLFVDGNHDNHILLQSGTINPIDTDDYKIIPMFGSMVGQISGLSAYHLRRGMIYTIDELKFFCMGGAKSVDKESRIENVSWWKDEEINYTVTDFALSNLEKQQYDVDIILSHTAPDSIVNLLLSLCRMPELNERKDSVSVFLEHVIQNVKYKKLFCGHFHTDMDINKTSFLYDKIVPVERWDYVS